MTIKVTDLYSGNSFDPAQIVKDGYTGVIFKGGQGAWSDVPQRHKDWRDLAHNAGLDVGWYWLVDARVSPESHKAAIKATFPTAEFDELGLWLDCEKPYAMTDQAYLALPYSGYKTVESVAWGVKAYSGKFPRGIYTSPSQWALIFRCSVAMADWFAANMLLWTAQYPWVYIPGVSQPKLYGSWKKYTFWQYHAEPDVNLFNGTDAEYFAMFGGEVEPPEPPEPEPVSGYEIHVRSNHAELISLTEWHQTYSVDLTDKAIFDVIPFPVEPPPPPEPPKPPEPPAVVEYIVAHDTEYQEVWRPNLPEVFHFDQDAPTKLTAEWQRLIMAMNPGLTGKGFRSLLQYNRAFTNGSGFNDDDNPHADYINRQDLDAPLPKFDKTRVCGGAILRGSLKGNVLTVETLDGSKNPPPVDYIMARPWLYFRCVTIRADGTIGNFPQNDGNPIYLPVVATGVVTVTLNTKEIAKPYPWVRVK